MGPSNEAVRDNETVPVTDSSNLVGSEKEVAHEGDSKDAKRSVDPQMKSGCAYTAMHYACGPRVPFLRILIQEGAGAWFATPPIYFRLVEKIKVNSDIQFCRSAPIDEWVGVEALKQNLGLL